MRYLAAAFDYDGTIAGHGQVDDTVVSALKKLKVSGRKLIMVTGRHLEDLIHVFPDLPMFDLVVCENGGLLYDPATQEETKLTEDAPPHLVEELLKRGVTPMDVGRCIIATWEPHENTTLETIKDLGLEMQVIFNKGAVMVLPSGVNKGTGLMAALEVLELSAHNVIGFGDAENDHAFLSMCELSVAVANALPSIKERADVVTEGDHGKGVIEVIDKILEDELKTLPVSRHELTLGKDDDGNDLTCSPYETNILIAGPSGGGKSSATLGFLDGLMQKGYQFCIIDPEGDYEAFGNAVVLGDAKRCASLDEIMQILAKPVSNVIVNLLGLPLEDRPRFFLALLPRLQELRAECGRPHWLVIDEAHHLLPSDWEPIPKLLPKELNGLLLITVHADKVSPAILANLNLALAISDDPRGTLQEVADVLDQDLPGGRNVELEKGEGLLWNLKSRRPAKRIKLNLSDIDRRRHRRKYAEGELPEDMSFFFTGPDDKLNLRAQNLIIFSQVAKGIDDDTWAFHLKKNDYSKWFKKIIKDEELAEIAADAEKNKKLSPAESREKILEAIEERYTAPA